MSLFLSMLGGPRCIHLCGNPDWDFLLRPDSDPLSLDARNNRDILAAYHENIRSYLASGKAIAWGAVPTHTVVLERQSPHGLARKLVGLWEEVAGDGLTLADIAGRSLITPATCCLVNPDLTTTVEKAFELTSEVSSLLGEAAAMNVQLPWSPQGSKRRRREIAYGD
ncbi:MAG: hypothetical protein SWK76_04410 [Actinomycetota bacterium]|nr:hypothetical protein [Actinomycetota bacterium]